jgi:hypothetical protein
MKLLLALLPILVFSQSVVAFGSGVICFGEDNFSVELNSNRTKMKVTVEGESMGWARVVRKSLPKTGSLYSSKFGQLTLGGMRRDMKFKYPDEEKFFLVECQFEDEDEE